MVPSDCKAFIQAAIDDVNHMEVIFQTTINDRKRFQKEINIERLENQQLLFSIKHIQYMMTSSLGVKLGGIHQLVSLQGCMEQALHTDYDRHCALSRQCYGIIFAIMDNTKLYGMIGNKKTLFSFKSGSVFIFRGDFIHAGADYAVDNVRLHMYFDCSRVGGSCPREHNKTYLVTHCN